MEELSIEEKAKRYDEALERASKLQENSNGIILKKWLWDVFPELKESEDEQIKKAIIHILKGETGYISKEDTNKYIAWLEKISEQSHNDKIEPKFKVGDWVLNKLGDSWHIDSIDKKNYQVSDGKGNYNYFPISKQDEMHRIQILHIEDIYGTNR